MFILNLIVVFILITFFIKFQKVESNSFLSTLKSGLNQKSKTLAIIFYIHCFTIRILISLLVGFSTVFHSIVLWGILIVIQSICVMFSVMKFFDSYFMTFINSMTEILVLIVIAYGFSNQFLDLSTSE